MAMNLYGDFFSLAGLGMTTGLALSYSLYITPSFRTVGIISLPQRLYLWSKAYDRGSKTIPIFTVVSAGIMIAARGKEALGPALLATLIVPYTLITMLPTNKRLKSLETDSMDKDLTLAESNEAERLMDKWSYLHIGRVAILLSSFLWGLARVI